MNADLTDDGAADPFDERPSKTQRKKEMTALQLLGTRLTRLNSEQLQRLPLPERLRGTAVRPASAPWLGTPRLLGDRTADDLTA